MAAALYVRVAETMQSPSKALHVEAECRIGRLPGDFSQDAVRHVLVARWLRVRNQRFLGPLGRVLDQADE
jgi:hypothetical protein